MGGGKALRRRTKNAERANVSLHKAASGKGRSTMPLPSAPTKDDYKDKMPASLRRMLAIKEAAEQPAPKRRKLEQGHAGQQLQQQQSRQGRGAPDTLADGQQQQQDRHKQQQDGSQQQQQQQQQQQEPAQNASSAWQQPKRLKQKKKEYLNAKKAKKKGKAKHAAAAQADMEFQTDRVAFGHVVHAPPEVALKSKHWAANAKKQQQQQQQQQQASQQASSGNKQKQRQRTPTQQAPQDDELNQMREQLIETYRSGRPAPQEGLATLKTLKELVKKQGQA